MPYSSNNDLPEDVKNVLPPKPQTIYRNAFNSAYETYDGDEKKALATAWTAVKTKYEKKDNKWVLKKKVESKVVSGGIDFNPQSEDGWVAVAKVGQEALLSPDNKIVTYGEEGLKNYADALKSLDVTYNHDFKRKLNNEQITNAKFEDDFLYMQISDLLKEAIKDEKVSGLSIEGIPKKIKDGILLDVEGTALTLMEYPQLPACKLEDGCGGVSSSILEEVDITASGGAEVDVSVSSQAFAIAQEEVSKYFDVYVLNNVGSAVKIGTDAVYGTKKDLKDTEFVKTMLMQRGSYYGRDNLQFYEQNKAIKIGDTIPNGLTPVHTMSVVISKQEPELLESDNRHLERVENIEQTSRGGDAKGMEKEEPITFTGEQVDERVASAVGEAETNLKNQQEVDIAALKEAEIKAKEESKTKHEKELKDVAELSLRKAKAMGDFKAKLNLSEEAEKGADVLPVEALEYFNGLDIHLQESPGGVTSGAPEGEKPQETIKDIKNRFNRALGRGVKEE